MKTDRIPGFAICAHCGLRTRLASCRSCGLLTCRDCGGESQCIQCFRERAAWARRILRRERVATVARRAVVVGCVAMSGFTAAGAALLPVTAPQLFADPHSVIAARSEVHFVSHAVEQYLTDHEAVCPPALHVLRDEGYMLAAPIDPWGEPLLFGCVDGPRTFVVLSKGPDREVGTPDDLIVTAP